MPMFENTDICAAAKPKFLPYVPTQDQLVGQKTTPHARILV